MTNTLTDATPEFQTLVEIIAKLRGPGGCPWDKEQTQKSLTPYIIEEAYELVEALESGLQSDIREELGDFLFQVVLQAQVAKDNGDFDMKDVLKVLNDKLIRRHPHVFKGDGSASIEEVWRNWQKIKNAEKAPDQPSQRSVTDVFQTPPGLPSLQVASKIGRKTQTYGFDWSEVSEVLAKVREELEETAEALEEGDESAIAHEIGDLLFSTAQLARHLNLDPESVLREANHRFVSRFAKTVELSGKSLEEFTDLPNPHKEEAWEKAKAALGKT